MNDYAHELEVALAAVTRAARLCRNVQGSLAGGAVDKADRSPVTAADFGSQALVCRALEAAFPADPVVGEEGSELLRQPEHAAQLERVRRELAAVEVEATGDEVFAWIDRGAARDYSARFWTLDPIDGTKGFLRGDNYAVALALIVGGRLVVSAVAAPRLAAREGAGEEGVVFHAVAGQGAWARPLAGGEAERLMVSDRQPPHARVCQSFEKAHSDQSAAVRVAEALGIEAEPVRIDSLAKYGLVARGEAEIYLRLPNSDRRECLWDHAAGILLVTEAGGVATDAFGEPLDLTCGARFSNNRGVIASNGPFHQRVLDAYAQVLAG
jgi:3'(2'), 5'-bisphosphate nucleotidase